MPTIAIVQCEVADADINHNLSFLETVVGNVRRETDIVVFPELYLTGFLTHAELAQLALPLTSDAIRTIEALSEQHGIVISVGFAERDGNRYFNSVAWVQPGRQTMVYRKNYLWLCDLEVYSRGEDGLVLPYRDLNFGIAICFDIEFPETGRVLANAGAEVLLVSNGNMQPYGHIHRIAAQARAIENHCYVIMCNRVGSSRGRDFVGDSLVVDPQGIVISELGTDTGIAYVELDKEKIKSSQAAYCYLEYVRRGQMEKNRRDASDILEFKGVGDND